MATRWREERGFTIIELMAALIVTMVIVGAGFTALTTTDKAARINDLVVQTQQNSRIAMEFLSRDVKTAGFGMTAAVGTCANAINPQDNTPGGADTGPDAVALVVPTTSIVAPVWTLAVQVTGGPIVNTITLQAGAGAAMTTAGLAVNSTVSIAGAASGTVAGVAGDVITLVNPIGAPTIFPVGTQVYLLQCITYAIGTAIPPCTGTATCLATPPLHHRFERKPVENSPDYPRNCQNYPEKDLAFERIPRHIGHSDRQQRRESEVAHHQQKRHAAAGADPCVARQAERQHHAQRRDDERRP